MWFRWARKRFPDGSMLKSSSRESWTYLESDGHRVDVEVGYAGAGIHPQNIVDERSLSVWDFPTGEPIPRLKQNEIVAKLEEHLGHGSVRIVRLPTS